MPACIVTSRLVTKCDHCGKPAVPVHMPQVNPSIYCKDCCPVCSPQSGVSDELDGYRPFRSICKK
jgi:hypothetical protein